MSTSDPIADMLTRIRNANTAKHDTVDVPSSKMKLAIAGILLDEGYIEKYDLVDNGNFKDIRITLKYQGAKKEQVISGIKRISKPGLRIYVGKDEIRFSAASAQLSCPPTRASFPTRKHARKLSAVKYWRTSGNNSFIMLPALQACLHKPECINEAPRPSSVMLRRRRSSGPSLLRRPERSGDAAVKREMGGSRARAAKQRSPALVHNNILRKREYGHVTYRKNANRDSRGRYRECCRK